MLAIDGFNTRGLPTLNNDSIGAKMFGQALHYRIGAFSGEESDLCLYLRLL